MDELLKKGSTLIMLGTGGVGKTTIAAALGLAAAGRGLDTAVITVDPARRLRDALGLEQLGGKPLRLARERLSAAGLDPSLRLSAMVLDTKGAWDALVERFAAKPETRARILNNPFYRNLTEQFAGSEAYAALQQLYDLHTAGGFALEVVDTPPAAHAFEFLQAPARLTRLLDSRTARWLFTPYVSAGRFAMKLASSAARFVVRELERFAGAKVLSSISEFFTAASEAVDGVLERLRKTEALLHSSDVHFILVTTSEEDRLRQARQLVDEMAAEHLRLSAIVINRFLDEETWNELTRGKGATLFNLEEIKRLRPVLDSELVREPGLAALLDHFEEYRLRSHAEIARVARFARELPGTVRLALAPEIKVGVGDLATLAAIAEFLLSGDKVSARLHRAAAHLGRGHHQPEPEARPRS